MLPKKMPVTQGETSKLIDSRRKLLVMPIVFFDSSVMSNAVPHMDKRLIVSHDSGFLDSGSLLQLEQRMDGAVKILRCFADGLPQPFDEILH